MPTSLASSTNHPHWEALRTCWKKLTSIKAQPLGEPVPVADLRQRHADVVDALVAKGELEIAVADELRAAFEQAVAHLEGKMGLCYIAFPIEFAPREDLMMQITVLQEIASSSDIDSATIAQIRASLERDKAGLRLAQAAESPAQPETTESNPTPSEAIAQVQALLARDMAWLRQFQAGESPAELETTEPNSTTSEAVQILAELLLGDEQ
jgi:hypothetical protein